MWTIWAALAWGGPSPDEIEAELSLAATAYEEDRYDEGLAVIDALIESLEAEPWTPLRVRALVFRGALLREQDRYEEARAVLEEALGQAERLPPSRSLSEALTQLAQLEQRIGAEDRARELLLRAIEVHERIGVLDATYAQALMTLGSLYEVNGALEQAESCYRRGLVLQLDELPPEHPDVALTWVRIGNIAWRRADWDAAREAYGEAVARYTVSFGPDDPDLAVVLANLATVEKALGNYEEARRGLERALEIHQRVLGDDDQLVATDLSNLGGLWGDLGDYAQSATYHLRALDIRLALFGEQHPKVAVTLNNLGMSRFSDGQLDEALEALERALDITEGIRGPRSVDVGSIRLNLAMVMAALGRLGEARDCYALGLDIIGEHLGSSHPTLATGLNNLANLEVSLGDVERAVGHQRQALAIQREKLGEAHPLAVVGRSNLAIGLLRLGHLEEAEALHAEALGLAEGVELTAVQAESLLEHSAWLHVQARRHALALQAREELLRRRTETLPDDHPALAAAMQGLAESLEQLGQQPVRAAALRERAWRMRSEVLGPSHPRTLQALQQLVEGALRHGAPGDARRWLDEGLATDGQAEWVLAGLSARERRLYLRQLRPVMDLVLSLPGRGGDAEHALETVLRYQGAPLRLALAQRSTEAEHLEVRETVATLRRRLASEGLRRPGSAAEAAQRTERLRRWTDERDALERRLAAAGELMTPPSVARICQALGPEEALVDQVRYVHTDASVPEGEARYVAFVLRGGACGTVHRVALGDAVTVERTVGEARSAYKSKDAREQRRAGGRLRELVWDPLQVALDGAERVWVVPDGSLATVSLAALPTARGFLLEEVTLGMLTHAEALVETGRTAQSEGLLLVGGVSYGETLSEESCLDRTFTELPGTLEEVQGIARTAKRRREPVTVLTGQDATERRVRELAPGKRVLHLATHGFFTSQRCSLQRGEQGPHPRWVADDNPLVRSGLGLAGEAGEDGLWTAEEVAGLDLSGTELVVLSACDTGLGEVEAGDGVLGLRRGLALAGAGAVVMSLWEVPDQDTSALMRRLYREFLSRGRDPVEALRRAQLVALRDARRRWGEARPELWGAFVISGKAAAQQPD